MRVLFKNNKDGMPFAAEITLVKYTSIIQELIFYTASNDEIYIPICPDKAERIICELCYEDRYDLSDYRAYGKGWYDVEEPQSVRPCHHCGYVIDLSLKDLKSGFVTCPRCKGGIDITKPMPQKPIEKPAPAPSSKEESPQAFWRKYLPKSQR